MFDPWVGKILWRRKWLPTSAFLLRRIPWTGEPGGLQPCGQKESDTTEGLNNNNTDNTRHPSVLSDRQASPLTTEGRRGPRSVNLRKGKQQRFLVDLLLITKCSQIPSDSLEYRVSAQPLFVNCTVSWKLQGEGDWARHLNHRLGFGLCKALPL